MIRSRTTPHCREFGFTLPELVITLAVGAILTSIAIPSFTGYIDNNRIITQTNELIATVNRARSEAMTRNELVVVCPSNINEANPEASTCSGNGEYQNGWLVYVQARPDEDDFELPDASPYDQGDATQTLLDIQFGEDRGEVEILASAYGQDYIGFAPDGSLRSFAADGTAYPVSDLLGDAVSLGICDERGDEYGRLVQILHTGRTRITRPDASGGTFDCNP